MENDSELIGERIEIPRDGKASVKANLYVPDSIGDERSEYGLGVIKKISKELTQRYGKGYDRSNLYHCLKFYKTFPEIVDTACKQSGIIITACSKPKKKELTEYGYKVEKISMKDKLLSLGGSMSNIAVITEGNNFLWVFFNIPRKLRIT